MTTRLFSALALAGLLLLGTASLALAAGTEMTSLLAGSHEVEGGDPDGSGRAVIDIDIDRPGLEVCFQITVAEIDAPSAAHIHTGGAGSIGDVVVDLDWENTDGSGCVTAESPVLVAITTNPSLYYVNVHNAEFPAGAIRGQLSAPFSDPDIRLALTGSNTTSLLAAVGVALLSTGGLLLRVVSRHDRR